jgi:hypothetical protein
VPRLPDAVHREAFAISAFTACLTLSVPQCSPPPAKRWGGVRGGGAARTAQRIDKTCHLWLAESLCTGCAVPAVAAIISQGIWSCNPAHSRALRRHLKAERGAALAPSCLASTGPERLGDPPWGKTTPRDPSLPADGHDQRKCWKRAVRWECDPAGRPTPCGAPKGAAFPSPRARGRARRRGRPARRAWYRAPLGAPPPRLAEGVKTRRPGGKHDGQPWGRAMPRTISHGCLASESDENADACPGRGAARSSYGAVHR